MRVFSRRKRVDMSPTRRRRRNIERRRFRSRRIVPMQHQMFDHDGERGVGRDPSAALVSGRRCHRGSSLPKPHVTKRPPPTPHLHIPLPSTHLHLHLSLPPPTPPRHAHPPRLLRPHRLAPPPLLHRIVPPHRLPPLPRQHPHQHHLHGQPIHRLRRRSSPNRRRGDQRPRHRQGGRGRGALRRERRHGRGGVVDRLSQFEGVGGSGGGDGESNDEAGGVRGPARTPLEPPPLEGVGLPSRRGAGSSQRRHGRLARIGPTAPSAGIRSPIEPTAPGGLFGREQRHGDDRRRRRHRGDFASARGAGAVRLRERGSVLRDGYESESSGGCDVRGLFEWRRLSQICGKEGGTTWRDRFRGFLRTVVAAAESVQRRCVLLAPQMFRRHFHAGSARREETPRVADQPAVHFGRRDCLLRDQYRSSISLQSHREIRGGHSRWDWHSEGGVGDVGGTEGREGV
mmetsp:Transcript_10808/g.22475  ORF Transcript_10808/g.22475 Transcript_10808/m.22475 type:complete len:456 (+) Transcript_10808:179-1546(+)